MAEAAVDNPTNSQPSKYFCHQCSDSVEIKTSSDATNLTCPVCDSSFIEELTQELENDHLHTNGANERPLLFLRSSNPSNFLSSMLFSMRSLDDGDGDDDEEDDDDFTRFLHRRQQTSSQTLFGSSRQQPSFPRFLEQIIGNLTSNSTGAGHSSDFLPFFPSILQGFHGDPRDYAWGADGIDNVITELLNQMEGSGPPPAAKENIDTLPSVTVTQDLIDRGAQCSVCMENFVLDETVRSLPCQHVFHNDCIVPWLQLHRTCPICRLSLGGEASEGNHTDPSSLASAVNMDISARRTSYAASNSSNSSLFQDAMEEAAEQPESRVYELEEQDDSDMDTGVIISRISDYSDSNSDMEL